VSKGIVSAEDSPGEHRDIQLPNEVLDACVPCDIILITELGDMEASAQHR